MLAAANKAFVLSVVNRGLSLRRRLLRAGLAALVVGLVLAQAGPSTLADQPPTQAVERVNQALLHVMQNAEELGFAGRQDYLAPILQETFNLPAMARVAVGRYWDQFSNADRQQLIERFTRLSISTFASRFDGYSGERWQVIGTKEAPRGGLIVENRLLTGDGRTIPIDYLVHEFDGDWRIIDVYLDGSISELALRRSEFTSVLKSGGVDRLLSQIAQQVDRLGSAKAVKTN